MKKGTAVGWLLVAISVLLSIWVITGQNTKAANRSENGFVVDDSSGALVSYTGAGGDVVVPDHVTESGTNYSITSIGPNAFKDNTSITSIRIPTSVTSGLDATDFSGCANLTTITIADGNTTYSSSDGCVYAGTELRIVPPGKGAVNILNTTTTIAANAFIDDTQNTVTIPDSILDDEHSIGDQPWAAGFTVKYIGSYKSNIATWCALHSYNYESLGGGGGGGGTTYTVSYESNGGTGATAPQVVDAGNSITVAANGFTKTGSTFTAWNTAADGSGTTINPGDSYTPTADTPLYAQWTPAGNYTVTYVGNGATGGSTASQVVNAGNSITVAANGFTKTGSTFTAWNTAADGSGTTINPGDSYTPTANTPLYAQWTPAGNYTVTYVGNGATGGSTAQQTFAAGGSVNISANGFTRTGYTFTGWNTIANGRNGTAYTPGQLYNTQANLTLYAQWANTTDTYTVTYRGNGETGGSTAQQTFHAGENVSIRPNGFTKTGYTFLCWHTREDGNNSLGRSVSPGENYSTLQDLVLYAQWTQSPTYTITYNGNGGTMPGSNSTTFSQSFLQGGSTKIAGKKSFSREGFDLDYWTTNADGSGTRYNFEQTYSTSANLTLYAHWTATSSQTGASGTPTKDGDSPTHTKDATPATADGDVDPRIVLCVAVAALGIAIVVGSNRRKITYIHHKKDNIEE